MNQAEIQAALDQCAAQGGGEWRLPPGKHVSGTLNLPSGVTLVVPEGSRLQASPDPTAYPVLGPTVNETGTIRALLFAENAHDIAIVGGGVIAGNGDSPLDFRDSSESLFRPELVFLRNCRGVRIEGLELRDADFWTVHPQRCDDVVLRGLRIRNRLDRINTDGIDPDGCRNVLIEDCDIRCGDDAIVIKSTEGDAVEAITVRRCSLETPCAAIKVGTESLGTFRQIEITHCQIRRSRMGVGLFMKDGGKFEEFRFAHLQIESDGEFPLFIDQTPRFATEPLRDGQIDRILFEHIDVISSGRLFVQGGFHNPITNLGFKELNWTLPCDRVLGESGKPIGSVRSDRLLRDNPPERQRAQLTLAAIEWLSLQGLRFSAPPELRLKRSLLYADDVSGEVDATMPHHSLWGEPSAQPAVGLRLRQRLADAPLIGT